MTLKTRFRYLYDKARDIAQASPASKPLPALFFFTDPARTSKPEVVAAHLPEGCGVVYRHFGEAGAGPRARLLHRIATDRGLILLIGNDRDLALDVGAHGVHLREADLGQAAAFRLRHPDMIVTAACHDVATLAHPAMVEGAVAAIFVSPVFASRSASAAGARLLGIQGARAFAEGSPVPVYGLGGMTCDTIPTLRGCGLAGVGAVEAFL